MYLPEIVFDLLQDENFTYTEKIHHKRNEA